MINRVNLKGWTAWESVNKMLTLFLPNVNRAFCKCICAKPLLLLL